MKRTSLLMISMVVMLGFTSQAYAVIFGNFVQVNSEATTTPPAGYITHELMVTTSTDWQEAQLVFNLTAGSFYQHEFGSNGPPPPVFFAFAPTLRWDTYTKGWEPIESVVADGYGSPGGAVDIGGTIGGKFDTTGIDYAWLNTQTGNIGTSTIGRFTLSNNATGAWKLRLRNAGGDVVVSDGVYPIPVPEPNAIIIFGLSIPAWLFLLRRRKAIRGR